jgi:hypothetical protein
VDLVAYSFLNELPMGVRGAAERFLGPLTAGLAELLARGERAEDPGAVSGSVSEEAGGSAL